MTETITVTWTRPDGAAAASVEQSFPTPESASDALREAGRVIQRERQRVKDTIRDMEGFA